MMTEWAKGVNVQMLLVYEGTSLRPRKDPCSQQIIFRRTTFMVDVNAALPICEWIPCGQADVSRVPKG